MFLVLNAVKQILSSLPKYNACEYCECPPTEVRQVLLLFLVTVALITYNSWLQRLCDSLRIQWTQHCF